MKRVLGIGNALVDVLMHMDSDDLLKRLNLPRGSMQLINNQQMQSISEVAATLKHKRVAGGSASNTITGLAQLGAVTGFIGKVGHDEYGSFYSHDLNQRGVEAHLLFSNNPTGRCNVFISPDSERTMATFLGAAIDLIAEDLSLAIFEHYDILHIEGYLVQNQELLVKAAQLAKRAGLEISIDLASYNIVTENLQFLQSFVSEYVDIVFANEKEAIAFTGFEDQKAVNAIAKMVDIAVVKVGERGSFVQKGNELVHIIPEEVNAIDTTGAGDLYAAGFLYAYMNNCSLKKCGTIGSLCASQVIQIIGAKLPENQWITLKKEINSLD